MEGTSPLALGGPAAKTLFRARLYNTASYTGYYLYGGSLNRSATVTGCSKSNI